MMLSFPRLLAVALLLATSLLTGCGSQPVVVTDEESSGLVELSEVDPLPNHSLLTGRFQDPRKTCDIGLGSP